MSKNCVLCKNDDYTSSAYEKLCNSCRSSILWVNEKQSTKTFT
ncbi:MAG: hypothetical protein ACXAC7_00285 [Candidatus Hodarchaeales archaeon]|jgi:hypothetical protein